MHTGQWLFSVCNYVYVCACVCACMCIMCLSVVCLHSLLQFFSWVFFFLYLHCSTSSSTLLKTLLTKPDCNTQYHCRVLLLDGHDHPSQSTHNRNHPIPHLVTFTGNTGFTQTLGLRTVYHTNVSSSSAFHNYISGIRHFGWDLCVCDCFGFF